MATKFDVEQAVKKHLAAIALTGSLLPEDTKELASHLSDSIEQLMLQGLSGEEAFLVATKRLGTERQLATEYAKINPSMKANRIWVYLIFGFAGIMACFGLGELILHLAYRLFLDNESTTTFALVILTHLAMCGAIGLLVYHQRTIAAYLQNKLQKSPLQMVVIFVVVFVATTRANSIFKIDAGVSAISMIPMYTLSNYLIEFTFYLLLSTLFVALLSLLFTIKNPENASLRQLFTSPSIWFLLIIGFATKLVAASTRILPPHQGAPLISTVYFAAVYFIGAFIISYFNTRGRLKYIFWFGILGLLLEIIVGINADLGRLGSGAPLHTPYDVSGLLLGLTLGYWAARLYRVCLPDHVASK